MKQMNLIKREKSDYGGTLLNTRKGRSRARPLATKSSMHLVLRSTKATGERSFKIPSHARNISAIIAKFADKYGVKIISLANNSNHLHIHLQLSQRQHYVRFIRAVTAAIAMSVSGVSRWNKSKERFWDLRPFTRIVQSYRAFLSLRDYIQINQLEGLGAARPLARMIVARARDGS